MEGEEGGGKGEGRGEGRGMDREVRGGDGERSGGPDLYLSLRDATVVVNTRFDHVSYIQLNSS